MHRLCSLLGMPQNRFASIHVVGTNGKTSVTLTTAALLEAHGVRAGAYTSPHIRDWRERIQIGGEPIREDALVRALERTEQAAQAADRKAPDDEGPVTQFELLTAAAFVAFADARVKVAVIEAGLGGRLDATNVIPSKLTVLTSVGLDHTEWLGDTLEEIALEKLAVLRDHTQLLHGPLPPEVSALVRREIQRHHASGGEVSVDEGSFQSRNFDLASSAALSVLGSLDPGLTEHVYDWHGIPGRLDVSPGDPLTIFDAAHNPDGARALVEALPRFLEKRFGLLRRRAHREVVCCLAILAEKDAKGIVEALAPSCSYFVCTQIPPETVAGSGRPAADSHPAGQLAELCREAGAEAEAIPDPVQAWERAKALARERDAVALAAGSHYLLAQIWTERPALSS
jgi:dihydrofolate synthase/folylpolyglutamate synthase